MSIEWECTDNVKFDAADLTALENTRKSWRRLKPPETYCEHRGLHIHIMTAFFNRGISWEIARLDATKGSKKGMDRFKKSIEAGASFKFVRYAADDEDNRSLVSMLEQFSWISSKATAESVGFFKGAEWCKFKLKKLKKKEGDPK